MFMGPSSLDYATGPACFWMDTRGKVTPIEFLGLNSGSLGMNIPWRATNLFDQPTADKFEM